MKIELINPSYFEGRTEFKIKNVKRKWDTLIMIAEGEYSIFLKEKQLKLILKKGNIMLIPSGVEFEREVLSPLTYYQISFYPQADHPFYLSASLGRLQMPSEQSAAVFGTLQRVFMLPDNRELLVHLVEHIFAQNYLFANKNKVKLKTFSGEVESAIRYMRRNFDKKIDMDALAAQVFLSHSGLIWKFKQELGTTPSNYLSILRLQHAKQLLLNHPYSITRISEMCGYSNPYYFTNAFHRYSGMSPTDFRRHYLKDEAEG